MKKRFSLFTLCALLFLPTYFCSAEVANNNVTNESFFEALRGDLEKTKADIHLAESKWLSKFDERARFYQDKTEHLSQMDGRLKRHWNYDGLLKDYNYVVDIWRMFADHSFDNISGASIERSFPVVPHLDMTTRERVSTQEYSSLQELTDEVTTLFSDALSGFDDRQEKDSLGYSRVLLSAGKLRSQQYQRLQFLGYLSADKFSKTNREDFIRELRIIPVRWTATFYSKLLEFRDYSRAGIEGYFYIAKELLLFLCLISFCVFFMWSFRKFVSVFEGYAEKIHKTLISSSTHWIWMYVLTVLNKSIPWILLLLGVWFAIGLVEASSFKELSNLFPYVDFYIYYRLYLIIADDLFTRLKGVGFIDPKPDQKLKLFQLNRSTGRFLFISIAILHTINTVVGKAMVYSTTFNILYVFSGIYIVYLSSRWSEEIFNSKAWLDIAKKFSPSLQSMIKKTYLLSSLVVFLITISLWLFDWSINYLGQFDNFKKLSAFMLRMRLNKAHDIQKNGFQNYLPESYLTQFKSNRLAKEYITENIQFKEAVASIENWITQNDSHHSMLIYGSNGAGKSIFISELNHHFNGKNSYIIDLQVKETNGSGIIKKLQNVLGGETNDLEKLIKFWKSNVKRKTVIYIDNAHNLFLSQINGFEGIQTLMRIINADIDNIFWCVSFHRESWHYIRRAMSEYQCFDRTIELHPWSAEELQKYIMKCHTQSGFKISFDNILTLLGKKKRRETRNTIESRFFKLLWEQTEGNPTRAVNLWLRSLSFDGNETMKVTTPPLEDMSNFLDLDDDIHFMCASLIRHEILTREQIRITTTQSKNVISRIVKYALEKKLIVEQENNILRLNPDLAGQIIRSLRRKNYVYG